MRHRIHPKKPCRICRRWYRPDPRVGARQKTCGSPECQREWNRRLSRARRAREPHREREDRLRDPDLLTYPPSSDVRFLPLSTLI